MEPIMLEVYVEIVVMVPVSQLVIIQETSVETRVLVVYVEV